MQGRYTKFTRIKSQKCSHNSMFGVGAVTGEVPAQRKRMTLCDNNVGAYL